MMVSIFFINGRSQDDVAGAQRPVRVGCSKEAFFVDCDGIYPRE